MPVILFSVYYPHENRFKLIRKGLIPLLDKIKYDGMDYFLSTYKGENITMMVDSSNMEVKTIIENHFHNFFVDNSIEVPEKKLPLNQLFLDFKPNSIHFWDYNPFKNRQRALKKIIIQKNESELSNKCLSVLSNNQSWDMEESVQFYLNILIIIDCLLHFDSMVSTSVANILQLNLKSKFNRKVNLYREYLKNGEGIYTSNSDSIIRHYEYIKKIVKSAEIKNSDLSDWISIVKNLMNSPESDFQISSSDLCGSLIFGINQKIDLNPKGLVIALGVYQSLNKEKF